MILRNLKNKLYEMQNAGYGNQVVNFYDQNGDIYSIDYVYCDKNGDCYLQSNNHDINEFTVNALLDELAPFDNRDCVYVEHYNIENNLSFTWEHIDGTWEYDETDGELTIKMHYDDD